MKYVRTRDGRILRLNEVSEKFFEGKKIFLASTYEELKQADAIDELIDDFIAKKDYGKPFVIKRYEIHSSLQFGFTIYGAIWVVGEDNEPILKPVAKMNEKGKLELL